MKSFFLLTAFLGAVFCASAHEPPVTIYQGILYDRDNATGCVANVKAPDVTLTTRVARCSVSLMGATIRSLQIRGTELLWQPKDQSLAEPGKWHHGGMPFCWPTYSRAEIAPGEKRIHSFAYDRLFTLRSKCETPDRAELVLGLRREGAYDVAYTIILTDRLEVRAHTENLGTRPFKVRIAWHAYFDVADSDVCSVVDATGRAVVDLRAEALDHVGEVARGELHLALQDAARGHRVVVTSPNALSYTVWHPGPSECQERTPIIDRLRPTDRRHFVCVEPVSSTREAMPTLLPGVPHDLTAVISLESQR